MTRSKVEDVMTREVVTATRATSFKELTRLLSGNRISGIPVVNDDGLLIGIVTESDLLRTEREREPQRRNRFLEWFIDRKRLAEIERLAADLRAGDLMTSEVVTVGPDTPVREAVTRLLKAGIKRLPVVDAEGRLVGIVSRNDLLRPFLRSDSDIRKEILDEVVLGIMLLDPATFDVQVKDGVVLLRGQLDLHGTKDLLVHLVERVDGVVGVKDELRYQREDRDAWPPAHPRGWPVPMPEMNRT